MKNVEGICGWTALQWFYPYTPIKGLEGNSEEIYFYDVPFSKLEQQVYLDIREIVGL